jgi:hypothetical protein
VAIAQYGVSTITEKESRWTDVGSGDVHHELYGREVIREGEAVLYELEQ